MKKIYCFIKKFEDQISNIVFVTGLLCIAVACLLLFLPAHECHVSASNYTVKI